MLLRGIIDRGNSGIMTEHRMTCDVFIPLLSILHLPIRWSYSQNNSTIITSAPVWAWYCNRLGNVIWEHTTNSHGGKEPDEKWYVPEATLLENSHGIILETAWIVWCSMMDDASCMMYTYLYIHIQCVYIIVTFLKILSSRMQTSADFID
jgi:hypothetical protein